MKSGKIISTILIYSLLIQTSVMDLGCTSFYPVKETNNLAHFNNYQGNIILKLKDNSKVQIISRNFFFVNKPAELVFGIGKEYDYRTKSNSDFIGIIEKENIDSTITTRIIDENIKAYHIYWTKDGKRYGFENDNLITITPDSGKYFWIVRNWDNGEFMKIKNSDIKEIQLQETDWIATSLGVVVLLITFLVTAIVIAIESWRENDEDSY